MEGLDVPSPKAVIRASMDVGLFDEQQARAALVMADDRNLTSHTYNKSLATQIMARMPQHSTLLHAWLKAIELKLAGIN